MTVCQLFVRVCADFEAPKQFPNWHLTREARAKAWDSLYILSCKLIHTSGCLKRRAIADCHPLPGRCRRE